MEGRPLGKKLVLVVEDDRATSDILMQALEEEGYRCVPATDGHFALQMVRELRPHLITLDLDLPDLDGHSVLHSLRSAEDTRNIPVVVVSAYLEHLPRGDYPSVQAVVSKPFDVARLISTVRAVTGEP